MTTNEYKVRLGELTEGAFQEFNAKLGGGPKTREQRIDEYVHDPKHERRICQLLGLRTEDEKLTEAVLKSAEASVVSAKSARWSTICAMVACLVGIAAFIVALVALLIKK